MSDADKLREAIERAELELDLVEQRATEMIVFADGLEEAGLVVYAQRARCVCRDILTIAGDLRAERSARVAIQKQRDAFARMAMKYATTEEAPT